jgi:hypothetical protein
MDDTAAICDCMHLLAGSAERISVVSVKRAALSTVIITPNGLSARSGHRTIGTPPHPAFLAG